MPIKLKKTVKELLAEANAEVVTASVEDALKMKDDPNVVFVDIRDIRELDRDGRIPGAFHAPRGMLEFWIDPESPYYKSSARGRNFSSSERAAHALRWQRRLLSGWVSSRYATWAAVSVHGRPRAARSKAASRNQSVRLERAASRRRAGGAAYRRSGARRLQACHHLSGTTPATS